MNRKIYDQEKTTDTIITNGTTWFVDKGYGKIEEVTGFIPIYEYVTYNMTLLL